MKFGEQLLTAVISSGIVVGAIRLMAGELIKGWVKSRFDEQMEDIKLENAETLTYLNTDLKKKADESIEALRSAYAKELADTQARYQRQFLELQQSHEARQEELRDARFRLTQDTLEILKLRREHYTPLVEHIYRARNLARKALEPRQIDNLAEIIRDLDGQVQFIEETVFRLRAHLERDGVFAPVHACKNDCKNFAVELADYLALEAGQQQMIASQTFERLQNLFVRIDAENETLSTTLAQLGSAEAATGMDKKAPT